MWVGMWGEDRKRPTAGTGTCWTAVGKQVREEPDMLAPQCGHHDGTTGITGACPVSSGLLQGRPQTSAHMQTWVNPEEGKSEARLPAENKDEGGNSEGFVGEQKVGRSPLGEGKHEWTREPAVLGAHGDESDTCRHRGVCSSSHIRSTGENAGRRVELCRTV